MMMTLKARPQLNGNTPADFEEAVYAIQDALNSIETALEKTLANVTNGRNYQHLGEYALDEQKADRQRVIDAWVTAHRLLIEIAHEVAGSIDVNATVEG